MHEQLILRILLVAFKTWMTQAHFAVKRLFALKWLVSSEHFKFQGNRNRMNTCIMNNIAYSKEMFSFDRFSGCIWTAAKSLLGRQMWNSWLRPVTWHAFRCGHQYENSGKYWIAQNFSIIESALKKRCRMHKTNLKFFKSSLLEPRQNKNSFCNHDQQTNDHDILSVLFLCKPFDNCLYSPIGFCEPENRIIQPKNSLYVQQDSNSEPLVSDADTLSTVPLKHYKIEFNTLVCWLRLLNLAINSGIFLYLDSVSY